MPYLALRPFGGDAQVRAAHDLRRRELPDRAASVEFADLSRDLRRLLRSPLHLHLFHETYRGEGTTPRELDARRLFDAYLRRLRRELPNARETLSWIGGELYRGRRAALPASAAEERVAEWRKRHGFVSTAQVVKLDPLEELVAAGVLTRREESGAAPDGGGFAFAHQRLCERVLREELERQLDGAEPDGPRLLAWAFHAVGEEGGAGSAPLLAVLEELVAERVAAGDADAVDTLLDLDDGGARDPLLAAAIRSLGPVWTGDDGGPASRVLAALGQRALASGEDHRRLEVPACQGRDWLTAAGYGAVASRVDAVRLAAHRAEVERSPVAPEARLGLARVLDDRGQLERLERDTAAARACFLESLELLRGLVVALPDDPSLRRDVSVALNRLGVCDRAAGSPATAAERFAESVATMEEICAGEGGSAFLGDLAITLSLAADLAGEGGDLAGARRAMDRCLATMDQALEGAPGRGDLRRDRAVALKDAAGFEWSAGEGARARELVDDALTELRSLVVDEPHRADLRRDLALVLVRAGTMGDGAGAREEARGRFREADGLLSGLCEAEPGRRDLWFELAVVRLNLAASAEGETAKAATQAAIEALERLGTLGPLSPAAERLWTLARRLRDNHPAPDDGGRTCT